jgi:hypothetical protein
MTFDGSAIKALLDDAVWNGAVHGVAALVVDRSGPLFHHAMPPSNRFCRSSVSCRCWTVSTATSHACVVLPQGHGAPIDDPLGGPRSAQYSSLWLWPRRLHFSRNRARQ